MGNLFLGFPVARSKIADMITGTASPSEHASQHEDGGSDEIDVTGLVGAGGLTLPIDDIYYDFLLHAKNCLYQTVAGSGAITEAGDGVTAGTGTTVDSTAELHKIPYPCIATPTWEKTRTVIFNVDFSYSDGGNDEFHLVSGRRGNYKHIGFKIISQVIYGTTYETAESTIQLSGGANPDFNYGAHSLKFVYTPGTGVTFYVDGVERGTITTNLPSSTSSANRIFNLYVKTLTEGWHADIIFNSFVFHQTA